MTLAILGALLIGITLGLLGSGGSILTVPVLVYLLGHTGKVAIAESLAIVAGIAFVAMLPYARARQVDWRSVIYFGIPGMAGSYVGAWLAMFVSGVAQLILFALIMLLAAWMMLRKKRAATGRELEEGLELPPHPIWKIALEGMGVGVLTGLVGVGGGFLIVPALVLLGGLSMRIAVGTSLAIIFLKSLAGFWKYLGVLEGLDLSVDWLTIFLFCAVGIVGTFAGKLISDRINQQHLQRGFAVFLVIMSVAVLGKEVSTLIAQRHVERARVITRSEVTDVSRPLKMGTGTSRVLEFPEEYRIVSGASPLFQRAVRLSAPLPSRQVVLLPGPTP
jgi:uncharacterized protein